jgi:zinc transporter ZupT
VSEPLAAVLAWALLLNFKSSVVFGILFGLVAGTMTYIVVQELLPTALQFDFDNKVVTRCVVIGMLMMAASLCLFEYYNTAG